MKALEQLSDMLSEHMQAQSIEELEIVVNAITKNCNCANCKGLKRLLHKAKVEQKESK